MVSNVDSIQQMSDVTFVSRPSVQAIEGEFHMEQRKDPKLKKMINYLEKKPSTNDFDAKKVASQAPNFTLIDKILYMLNGRPWNWKRAV